MSLTFLFFEQKFNNQTKENVFEHGQLESIGQSLDVHHKEKIKMKQNIKSHVWLPCEFFASFLSPQIWQIEILSWAVIQLGAP